MLPGVGCPSHERGMAGIGLRREDLHILNEVRPHGIETYGADQFRGAGIFLTYEGLVTVLERLTVAPMDPGEVNRITGPRISSSVKCCGP